MMKKCSFLVGGVFLSILLLVPSLWGQATASGNLAGTVLDSTGAAIAKAAVQLKDTATNQSRSTHTEANGSYHFDLLPVGVYALHVEAEGFSTAEARQVNIYVATTTTQNVTLKPGAATETVLVSTSDIAIDTTKTDVSAAVTPEEIDSLPLNGRDMGSLTILIPGVRPVDSYDPTKNRYSTFGVNGSGGRDSNATVNGIDNKDNTVGGAVMQLPLEAVEEFNMSAERFSAANGRSEGSALNIITKSGSNRFHGSAFGFFRNDAFNTNDVLDEESDTSKPAFSRQQYGGSISGPLRKDYDFLFFAYEHLRERSNITVDPTAYDELVLVESYGAEPAHAIATPYDDTRYNGRFDHSFNANEKFALTYTAQDNKADNDQSGQDNDLTASNYTINDLVLSSASLSSILSQNLVNTAAVGYQYWHNRIDTTNESATYSFSNDRVYFGTNENVPQESVQGKWQFKDDLSWTHDKHTLRFGADYVWMPNLKGYFTSLVPEYSFTNLPSYYLNDTTDYPNGLRSAGAIDSITYTVGNGYSYNPGVTMFGVYAQDDLKVSRRLNVSLGVRWDKDRGTYGEGHIKANRTYQALAAIGDSHAGIPHTDNFDFSPRIGLTYDLTGHGNFIAHAGYGLYYGQTFLNIPWMMLRLDQKTVSTTYSVSGSDLVPGTDVEVQNYRLGIDPAPSATAGTTVEAGSSGYMMDRNFRNPYSQQINVGLQWSPAHDSILMLDYVQARGLHASRYVNINPVINSTTGERKYDAALESGGQTQLGPITDSMAINRSNYNAMNFSYRQNYSHWFNTIANFTWSKGLSYRGDAADFINRPTHPDDYFRKSDYGPVPSDTKFRSVLSGTVHLPWKVDVAPILQLETARPYDAVQGSSTFLGYGSGYGAPHLIMLSSEPHNYMATALYSSDDYTACLANGNCKELHFDSLRGTPFVQLDARFGKTIKLPKGIKIETFFQAFNLTNRANWGNDYDGDVQDVDIDSTTNAVVGQGTFMKPEGFMNPSSTAIPHSFEGEWGIQLHF